MVGENKYIRIPPESTGDRVANSYSLWIPYVSKDAAYVWTVDDTYIITGGGGPTVYLTVYDFKETTSTDGWIFVALGAQPNIPGSDAEFYDGFAPIAGQNITDTDGVTRAVTQAAPTEIFHNESVIVGGDNKSNKLRVDRDGAARITFAEGAAEVSNLHKLIAESKYDVANYSFDTGPDATQFVQTTVGTSSVAWDPLYKHMALSVNSADGEMAAYTTRQFHSVVANRTNTFFITARSGDSGKQYVVRNWGAFDASNGFFFSLNGSDDNPGDDQDGPVLAGDGTALRIVHRFSFNGVTTDVSVLQKDWNRDTLLGTGGIENKTGYTLDVTDNHLYWIDYQPLGGGKVRYGVFVGGQRIVCHEMTMGDSFADHNTLHNSLGITARPMCWAIKNSGGTPASPSYFYGYGGAVERDGDESVFANASSYSYFDKYTLYGDPASETYFTTKQANTSGSWTPGGNAYTSVTSTQYMFTLAPLLVDPLTGAPNHGLYLPTLLEVSGHDATTDAEEVLEIRIFSKCILRGTNFNTAGYGYTIGIDSDGHHLAHAPELLRLIVTGTRTFDLTGLLRGEQRGTVKNGSDQATARASQELSLIAGNDDKWSTGTQVIRVAVKNNPTTGSNVHLFDDKNAVVFRNLSGGTDLSAAFVGTQNLKTTDGDWYYLSLVDRDEAWLYNSAADIDDDREVRALTVSAVGTTAVGDTLTITSGPASGEQAYVMHIDGLEIWLEGRSSSTIDVGLTSGDFDTTTGGASVGTISSVALKTRTATNGYPLDYRTSLLAVTSTAAGFSDPNEQVVDDLLLYGPPPPQPAWTFMARWISGNTAHNDTDVRWTISWQEWPQ